MPRRTNRCINYYESIYIYGWLSNLNIVFMEQQSGSGIWPLGLSHRNWSFSAAGSSPLADRQLLSSLCLSSILVLFIIIFIGFLNNLKSYRGAPLLSYKMSNFYLILIIVWKHENFWGAPNSSGVTQVILFTGDCSSTACASAAGIGCFWWGMNPWLIASTSRFQLATIIFVEFPKLEQGWVLRTIIRYSKFGFWSLQLSNSMLLFYSDNGF